MSISGFDRRYTACLRRAARQYIGTQLLINSSTRILGIDPGLRITGYGVVESGPQGPVICEAGVDPRSRRQIIYGGADPFCVQRYS